MNKTELVAAVAAKAGISKKDADAAVAAVFASVADALANGDKVQLIGFGTFEVRERSEKTARNPRTGETMTVPATKVPAFKAGAALKAAVKSGKLAGAITQAPVAMGEKLVELLHNAATGQAVADVACKFL